MIRRLKVWGALFVLLLGTSLPGAYWFAARSLPTLAGRADVAGLAQRLEIVRDEHAIPHVFAASEADAYFGLGYSHAQDRLFQMELARRLARGTLAELLGTRALEADRLFRTLGLAASAEANVRALAADTREALAAYSAGVNAFLRSAQPLPLEFSLLRSTPAPWRPSDSAAVLKLLAWRLSGNWEAELMRLGLGAKLSRRQLAEFAPPYAGTPALPYESLFRLYEQLGLPLDAAGEEHVGLAPHDDLGQRAGAAPAAARVRWGTLADALRPFAPANLGLAVGSNNWVLDGSRTASGKPLLANDPHLALSAPSQWYFAHLNAPDLDVIGATIPGLPGVILGHNGRVAWAFTNTFPDTEDSYLERLIGADGAHYQGLDGARSFEVRREVIHVRDAEDVVVSVRQTRHGPVVSDLSQIAQAHMPAGHVLSLSWVGLRSDDPTLSFPILAARARSARMLREAARLFWSPAQNIVYADVDGAIGFVVAGKVPIRAEGNALRGIVPSPGWLPDYDWQGFLDFEQLPQREQPSVGRIVTANQDITPEAYPHWLGGDFGAPYRADRIAALLDARPKHDVVSFRAMQADVKSTIAARLLDPMLEAFGAGADARAARLIEALRRWDRHMTAHAREPLLFASWLRELARSIYEDELGTSFAKEWGPRTEFIANVLADRDGQSRWCDDVRTAAHESCAACSQSAFSAALRYLDERFGEDEDDWRWGDAHRSVAAHPVFGGLPILSALFNLSVPRGGDGSTIDVGAYELEEPARAFESRWGAGFRAIYDLSDLQRSVGILNSGQSGHVLSRFYRDMVESWQSGAHVSLVTRRESIEPRAIGTLVLEPARRARSM